MAALHAAMAPRETPSGAPASEKLDRSYAASTKEAAMTAPCPDTAARVASRTALITRRDEPSEMYTLHAQICFRTMAGCRAGEAPKFRTIESKCKSRRVRMTKVNKHQYIGLSTLIDVLAKVILHGHAHIMP